MDPTLFVSVQDACECYKKEITVKRAISSFLQIIDSFHLQPQDNIIPFLYMIINHPISFKDPNNYPSSWKKESSRANGVSSVNQCVNISIIKKCIGQEEVDKIRNALGTYITELQKSSKKKKEESELSDDAHSDISSNNELFIDRDHCLSAIEKLKEENRLLKFKNEKLFKMLNVFANGNQTEINKEWVALTYDLFNMME